MNGSALIWPIREVFFSVCVCVCVRERERERARERKRERERAAEGIFFSREWFLFATYHF